VTLLIQQIGRYEAKAAREHKLEKITKEAAKRTKFPTGIVTIAFSDVQCSTYQWEKFPHLMSEAMEIHNNIMRSNLKVTGGYEVKTEGDSFMVAFHSPVSAVWWCLFVQEGLLHAQWPRKIMDHIWRFYGYCNGDSIAIL
jgi:class 3 adenylate cyclase